MGTHAGSVMTLANSIIGVSVLAMPFCFKQCGIVLSIVMLLVSSIVSRLACHYLIKAAIMEKRKNFEMLAFRAFGPTGKLMVELCIIGFMLGTCVAYFVVVGDLGPAIIAPILGLEHPTALRPSVLIGLGVFVVLPLGLLRNVDSLSTLSAASIAFYSCLVLKVLGSEHVSAICHHQRWSEDPVQQPTGPACCGTLNPRQVMGEATTHLLAWDWVDNVYYWRPAGFLRCIPIFSMALSCQTQLFEIFDSLPNTPLDRMNYVVKSAINMTTMFYIAVGMFGYIAYCNQSFTGNLMMSFSQTVTSDVIKIGFVLSVAVSFPLVIFPCRASLYSLLFSKGHTQQHELTGSSHIPETKFQCITLVIVTASLITGLLIPNIELVLGLVGSTIGVFICLVFPAVIFVTLSSRNTNERLLAKILVGTGLVIMVLSTYTNLHATSEAVVGQGIEKDIISLDKSKEPVQIPELPVIKEKVVIRDETLKELKNVKELATLPELRKDKGFSVKDKLTDVKVESNVRQEPPIPIDPESKNVPVIPELQNIAKGQENVEVREKNVEKTIDTNKVGDKDKIIEEKKADLIEKLIEHKVIHTKFLEEEEKLLNRLQNKDNDGKPNIKFGDKIKVMDVKTGLVSDLKTLKPLKNEPVEEPKKRGIVVQEDGNSLVAPETMRLEKSVVDVKAPPVLDEVKNKIDKNLKERMVDNMVKGIPLPVAVKGAAHLNASLESKNKEVKVESPSRDILENENVKEREKRDLDEVEKIDKEYQKDYLKSQNKEDGRTLNKSVGADGSTNVSRTDVHPKSDNTIRVDSTVEDGPKKVEASQPPVLEDVQEKECTKKEIHTVNKKSENNNNILVEKGQFMDAKEAGKLIRTPSYLSDIKPVLDGVAVKLDVKSVLNQLQEPGRPLKRDLKSVDDPANSKKD